MPSNDPPPFRSTLRVPLLWVLIPLCAGVLAAQNLTDIPALPLLAIAVTGIALGIHALRLTPLRPHLAWTLWSLTFTVALFSLSLAYASGKAHPLQHHPGAWETLPPREAKLVLEVKRLFQSRPEANHVSGLARVLIAPPHIAEVENTHVYFRLHRSENIPPFEVLPTTRFEATGVLTYLHPRPVADDMTVSPGDFDQFLRASGVAFRFTRGVVGHEVDTASPQNRWLDRQNHFVRHALLNGLPDTTAARTYLAMMLGESGLLSSEQADAFRRSGAMHFFAISGLHIGIIAAIIVWCLKTMRLPVRLRPLAGLPLILYYVLVTGASPSAVRAFIMIAFFWGASLFRRRPGSISALSASAILVIIADPQVMFHSGFQLSYLVVGSILLYGLPLAEYLKQKLEPHPSLSPVGLPPDTAPREWVRAVLRYLADGLAIGLAAFLASQPLTLLFFGIFSPYSVFLNIILVLFAFPVIAAGMASIVLQCFSLTLFSSIANHLAVLGIEAMGLLVRWTLSLPGSSLHASLSGGSQVWLFVAVLYLASIPLHAPFRHRRYPRWFSVPLAGFGIFLGLQFVV